jgi:hypothetical protein
MHAVPQCVSESVVLRANSAAVDFDVGTHAALHRMRRAKTFVKDVAHIYRVCGIRCYVII